MKAEKVKEGFRARGETIKEWCIARGYDPTYVSRILNGNPQRHQHEKPPNHRRSGPN